MTSSSMRQKFPSARGWMPANHPEWRDCNSDGNEEGASVGKQGLSQRIYSIEFSAHPISKTMHILYYVYVSVWFVLALVYVFM